MRDASPTRSRASATDTANVSPHPLALSVMRLTAPLPNRTNAMPFITSNSSNSSQPPDNDVPDSLFKHIPTWEGEGAPCGVGALSVLPSSFGSIYASETFRSFISVFNQSTEPAQSVSVSVHIQTSSQRIIPLLDTTQNPRPSLEPRASINNIVKIALPELGVHKLLCAASYRDRKSFNAQIRTLRQVFRFNVLPPLEPSLSVIPLYKGLESFPFSTSSPCYTTNFVHYLVDLRVLNAVPVPVYLTDATFVPKPPFRVRSLLRKSAEASILTEEKLHGDAKTVEGRNASMGVGDGRNFLFHVYRCLAKPDVEAKTSNLESTTQASASTPELPVSGLRRTDHLASKSSKSITSSQSRFGHGAVEHGRPRKFPNQASLPQSTPRQLGHMTISWRSALGEVGHLDNVVTATEPFSRRTDIEVSVYAVPEEVYTHRPFVARCAARNNTSQSARLYLQVRRDLVGEIVPVGVSGVSLGEVQPGCTARCSITLIPLVRGQHSISGIRVVDIDSNMSYKAEPPVVSVS